MISVLILTKNEEKNIAACLKSVTWSDDVVVLDSLSSDRTVEIARTLGARVYQRAFDSELNQRRYSLREITFKHPWVYNPDADEVTPPDLADEIGRVVRDPARDAVAYRVRFKTLLFGRWLKHSSLYPTWVVRLFRPDSVSFQREVNLDYVISGTTDRLESHFEHHTFNNGFDAWFEKHNRYSSGEAIETIKELRRPWPHVRELLLSSPPELRRSALKRLSMRLPMRPGLRFLYMYFVRRGFLDGGAGLTYCALLSIYEYMIVLKVREMKVRQSGRSI